MIKNPKVTIIIPAYNVEKFIEKCINSLINQTYKNLEILIINDGSTDKTKDIIQEFEKKDSRIKVYNRTNHGVSATRNFAIGVSSGNYIAFVDGDDYVSPNYIELLLSNLIKYNLDFICCNFKKVQENKNIKLSKNKQKINIKIYNKEEYLKQMFAGNNLALIIACCKLVKAEFILNFNENLKHGEDVDYFYRLISNVNNAGFISNKLYFYVQRKGSSVNSKFNLRRFNIMYKLEEYAKENSDLEKYIRSWLYFSCLESFYFMLRDKVVDKNSYDYLYSQLKYNEKFLKQNKKVKLSRRVFAPIGKNLINFFIKKENKK